MKTSMTLKEAFLILVGVIGLVLTNQGCACKDTKPYPETPTYSFKLAMGIATHCKTETSWAEAVAPGKWVAVCGDSEGNAIESLGLNEDGSLSAYATNYESK